MFQFQFPKVTLDLQNSDMMASFATSFFVALPARGVVLSWGGKATLHVGLTMSIIAIVVGAGANQYTPCSALRGGFKDLPSFLSRSPRDSMSLARRAQNAQLFDKNGYPDLSTTDEEERLMLDKTLQWTWRQCIVSFEGKDVDGRPQLREELVAMTEEEIFDYSVLHFFIVNAHVAAASTYMSELGMDGSPYVRPDDPFEETRVRPLRIDREQLFEAWAIVAREKLREAVEAGNMQLARKVVDKEMGAEFWGSHPELLLRLTLQHFVELVKKGKYEKAVRFAQRQVTPFVEANPGYMVDLDRVFIVLAVDHQAPKDHPDVQAVRLLSKHRRFELFRDINDAMLRRLGHEPCDFIQQANNMHALEEDRMQELIRVCEEKVEEQPTDPTRIMELKQAKSLYSSLMSLEDIVKQTHDRWTALMDRVETEGLQPDLEVQAIIEKEFSKYQARLRGEDVESSGEEERWLGQGGKG